MNYFRINLNKLEDPNIQIRKYQREATALIVILIAAAALFGVTFKRYSALSSKRADFIYQADSLESEINKLVQGDDYISEDEVLNLYELTNERIFWTEKLEAMSSLVDTSIALTFVSYHRNKLIIRGITGSGAKGNRFSTISAFIDSIKAEPVFNEDFPHVEFSSSERIDFLNRPITTFEILCLPSNDL